MTDDVATRTSDGGAAGSDAAGSDTAGSDAAGSDAAGSDAAGSDTAGSDAVTPFGPVGADDAGVDGLRGRLVVYLGVAAGLLAVSVLVIVDGDVVSGAPLVY